MKTIRCPQCNLVNFSTLAACKRCNYLFEEFNSELADFQSEANDSFSEQVERSFTQSVFSPRKNRMPPNNFQSGYQSSYHSAQPKNSLAIASLVLGLVGYVFGCLGAFLLSPIGLILGIIALIKSNKRPQEYGGKGFAIAGVVLNSFLVLLIPVILAIAIPNLLAARRAANEGSAISILKTIADAQVKFAFTKYRCGELSELGQSQLIDSVLANGVKNGYVFNITRTPNGCDIYAKPKVETGSSATGDRSFYYSIEEGKLRVSGRGTIPTKESPIMNESGFPPGYSFTPPQIAGN